MWDPFRDLDRFIHGLNNTIGNAGVGPYGLLGGLGRGGTFAPPANVVEDNVRYTVEVDVPGVQKEDIQVRVEEGDNRICVSGKRAKPLYYQWLQEQQMKQMFGDEGAAQKGGFSHFESSVTTTQIDENGNITTTTTANNSNKDDHQKNERKGLVGSLFGANKSNADAAGDSSASQQRPLLIEKSFGDFERCFSFAQRIQKDSSTAELNSGVLTLTVDKLYPKGSGNHTVAVRGN